jgi:hypothetical protein
VARPSRRENNECRPIEGVTGTLQGRSGSFVFRHSGGMDQGAQRLSIAMVPGSLP